MKRCTHFLGMLCLVLGTSIVTTHAADVDSLIKQLGAADTATRVAACQQLGQLGLQAKPAVGPLVKLVSSETPFEIKRAAILALAALGDDAVDAVPALRELLTTRNAKLRAYAANALGQIGTAATAAAPDLARLITDKDPAVRRAVRDALPRLGTPRAETRPLLVAALKSAAPEDAAAALATLVELGPSVIPDLCDALGDDDACYWACLALGEMGPKAHQAVPQLAKLIHSGQPEVRMQALLTLAKIGPAAKKVGPQIAKLLGTEKFESVQYAAAYSLGCLGDARAIPALQRVLGHRDEFLRVTAAWAVLQLSSGATPDAQQAIGIVMRALQSDDANVRDAAARAIADDSMTNQDINQAVRKAFEGIDDPRQLLKIADALATTGKKIVPACIRSLEEERKLRFYALQVLIKVGPEAAAAVPALIKTLGDADASLRREAEFALGAIGAEAAPAVPALIARLEDDVDEVRYAACYALGNIGAAAKRAVPPLVKLATAPPDDFAQIAAVWALLKIVPDNPRLQQHAVPILKKALQDERAHIRAEVAGELGDIGAAAAPALEALQAVSTSDENSAVRKVAAEAVVKIKNAK